MSLSGAGVKLAVDLILKTAGKLLKAKDTTDAEIALAQLIRDLMQIDPNLAQASSTIARAKAKGITSPNLYLAQDMLRKVTLHSRGTQKPAAKASARTGPKAAGKASAKRAGARKSVKKSGATKMTGQSTSKPAGFRR